MSNNNNDITSLPIEQTTGNVFLKEFATRHRIITIGQLLDLPLSAMWRMGGFTMHAQNEIIDLTREHQITGLLKIEKAVDD